MKTKKRPVLTSEERDLVDKALANVMADACGLPWPYPRAKYEPVVRRGVPKVKK